MSLGTYADSQALADALGRAYQKAVIVADRRPTLSLVSYRLDDEKMGDGDGRLDAGETVRLYPKFRNSWGNAHNISYKLELEELEDPEIIEWMDKDESHMLSGLSSYASAESESPFIFKVNPECVDGRRIKMKLTATCDNISAPLEQELIFSIENGVELGGYIEQDITLTADRNYIVTNNLVIPSGVTVTIEPGTVIKFKSDKRLSIAGTLVAKGTVNDNIIFDLNYDNSTSFIVIDNADTNASVFHYCQFYSNLIAFKLFPLNKEGSILDIWQNTTFVRCAHFYLTDAWKRR